MYKDEFTKRWDSVNGFTLEEANVKKAVVDECYAVGTPTSKWNPAQIVPDSSRKSGYKVIICTKR